MIIALLLTIITGLFFIIGLILNYYFKDKKDFINFSISLSFFIILGLIIFDLIPEVREYYLEYKGNDILLISGFIISGILILKIIDLFIPHHSHEEEIKNKTHDNHLYHIGIVTSLAIILHNILEGILIYEVALKGIKEGILISLGVALHNIPMGMQISSSLQAKKEKILVFSLLVISGLLGALIIIVLSTNIKSYIMGPLMAITIGMLIYIVIFELLTEIVHNRKRIATILGCITGIIIVILSLIL